MMLLGKEKIQFHHRGHRDLTFLKHKNVFSVSFAVINLLEDFSNVVVK